MKYLILTFSSQVIDLLFLSSPLNFFKAMPVPSVRNCPQLLTMKG